MSLALWRSAALAWRINPSAYARHSSAIAYASRMRYERSHPALARGKDAGLGSLADVSRARVSRADAVGKALLVCTMSSTALASWRALSSTAAAESAAAAPQSPIPKEDMKITLYQYEVCPFCNKVRAYLDYNKIPYSIVEVDPMRKKELSFSPEYRKVPVAIVNDVQVNGSANIIASVHTSVYGQDEASLSDEEKRWVAWVDDHLAHLIAPNIYRTTGESLQTFNYISENAKFTAWQKLYVRYSGAVAMFLVAKRSKKKYNIDEPREALFTAINDWIAAVQKSGGPFLEGKKTPGVADLAVYGFMRAIATFDTFQDVKANCDGFEQWFEDTKTAVGESAVVSRS